MTISRSVYNQLFEQSDAQHERVIRLRPTEAKAGAVVVSAKSKIQMWTKEEHERFLVALEMFPAGPWKKVADYIGTKTPRQTMTHAQKYRQKIHRRQRGLRNQKKAPSAPSSPVPLAAATGSSPTASTTAATTKKNGNLLDILAHQATAIQQTPRGATIGPGVVPPQSSTLPSLAEILQLRGSPAPAAPASPKREPCSCNCRCGAHAQPQEAPRP